MNEKTKNELVTKGFLQEVIRGAIDELALVIARTFEAVERRIDRVEERIDVLEQRMADVGQRLDLFEKYTESRFDELSRELKEIRNQVKAVDTRAEVVALEVRVDKIERQLNIPTGRA